MMRQTRLPYQVHKTLQEATVDLKRYRLTLEAAGLDLEGLDAIVLHEIHTRLFAVLQWSRGDLDAKGVK